MKKKMSIFSLVALLSSSVLCADVRYEVGLGTNYGGFVGVTANTKIQPKIELFAGLGLVGAVAGARYYINDNIRLNANYGTNGLLYIEGQGGDKDEVKLLHGINIGADYMWNNGVSLGLAYMATSNKDDVLDEWHRKGYDIDEKGLKGDVKLSLGYRF